MAKIQAPPQESLSDVFDKHPQIIHHLFEPQFKAFLQDANERYLHWDEIRRRPMPGEMPPEFVWTYLRFQRDGNSQQAPFSDKREKPFTFWLPTCLQKFLMQIDRQSGKIISSEGDGIMPKREHYLISSLMEEAIFSSQLEGAATTRRVAKEMLRSGRRPRDGNERMIWNNWRTITHVRDTLSAPLTPLRVREIHALITEGTLDDTADAGRLRTNDEIVVYDQRTEEILHTPPPHQLLPQRLQQFCDFANDDDEKNWIHPVAKATMLHFWLAYDHPFVDGNGRTARAIFYWYLLSRGYWLFEYLSISRYFLKAPIQYAHAFQKTETDGGDLTYFLHFNLRVVSLALQDLHAYIARKQQEHQQNRELTATLQQTGNINARQQAILAHALRTPNAIFTIGEHKTVNDIAYGTARGDLLGLASRGFLMQKQRGKAFVFLPAPDLKTRLGQ